MVAFALHKSPHAQRCSEDNMLKLEWIGILGLCISVAYGGICYEGYQCQQTCYRTSTFFSKCGLFGWSRCTRQSTVSYSCAKTCNRSVCCEGYTGSECLTPICFGSTSCQNGGTCSSPDSCICPSGFLSPQCNDTNECNSTDHGCQHGCVNTNGSYHCTCRSGYTIDTNLKGCLDTNECNNTDHGCQHGCVNTNGSYHCTCRSGYTIDTNVKGCRDLNECHTNNGSCKQVCNNNIGSFTCDCRSGYNLNTDGRTCSDLNECHKNNGGCEQVCNNNIGSFTCDCRSGYNLNTDGRTCSVLPSHFPNLCDNRGLLAPKCEEGLHCVVDGDRHVCRKITEEHRLYISIVCATATVIIVFVILLAIIVVRPRYLRHIRNKDRCR